MGVVFFLLGICRILFSITYQPQYSVETVGRLVDLFRTFDRDKSSEGNRGSFES
jgi:hypothetical protein